jgi:integrase
MPYPYPTDDPVVHHLGTRGVGCKHSCSLYPVSYRTAYGGLCPILNQRAKAIGITYPTAHDFRRAFALAMLRNGVDLITLSRLMGHTTIKVLQRYLNQLPEDLQEAHRRGSPVDNMMSLHR